MTSTFASASPTRHVPRPPGFHRLAASNTSWVDLDGRPVTAADRARLTALRVPPGWTHVWASFDPVAPLQATGVDSRGRTQYRYSAEAVLRASRDKFAHLTVFATALPVLRRQVASDLDGDGLEAAAVTAAVVRLLNQGLFRIGSDRYRRDNHTFGLTTLRRSQVAVDGASATFDFVGKEHVRHAVTVVDPDVARVLRELLAQDRADDSDLFQIGSPPPGRRIDSVTVNAYIHAHADVASSAKTFRTWGASVAAAAVAAGARFAPAGTSNHLPDHLPVLAAAHLLGNTPAVARRSYIHPAAVDVGRRESVRSAVAAAAERLGTDDVGSVHADPALQDAVALELGRAVR